jgi:hypothetical protein
MPAHKARGWLEKLKPKIEKSPKVLMVDVNHRWQWRGGIGWPYLFVETDFMIRTRNRTVLIEVDNSAGPSALCNVAKYVELLSLNQTDLVQPLLIHIFGPNFGGETQRNFKVHMLLCETLAHKLNIKYFQRQIFSDDWNETQFNEQVYGYLKNKHLI